MSKYITAPEVAAICDVDLKTIHNWTESRDLLHFKTPGNHLRFKPRELVPWLKKHGYDVPAQLEAQAEADTARIEGAK